ncbi:receptor-like protein EIX2 isoform X2 [Primulina huaijiensis]|uniref:receptor-like protein EIX2 isoform X2 n=1 Tax=Primulina huaijiensis TaxID=1492673 RepID=UPI003CC716DF
MVVKSSNMKTDTSIKLLTPLRMLLLFILLSKPILRINSSFQGHGVRCLDRERLALLEFKNGMKHPDQTLYTWGNEDHKKDCCKWQGVLCHNRTNHVVELNLEDIESTGGNISEALGNLVSLSYLDLSGQKLKGMIPNTLGNLTFLSHLDLSNNNLEGAIPDSLGNLMHLSHLDLSDNQLEGGIPVTLGNITRLSHLDLSNNMLEGSIPDTLWTLSSLSYLDISNNKISGTIPDSFEENSSGLSYLDMSHNHIFGPVPDLSSNFLELLTFDLSFNELNGSLPLFSSALVNMDLRKNKISGKLNGICSDTDPYSLALLDVLDNLLSGELPTCLHNFESLQYLNLANNNLSGEIQDSIRWPSTLDSLHLWNNSFRGEIPKSLRWCSGLRYMVLGENYFTGKIPAWIGESLSGLSFLSLTSNYFNGSLPSTLCNLPNLQVLDISSNKISGTIPSCFNNLTSMYSKTLHPHKMKYHANAYIEPLLFPVKKSKRECNYINLCARQVTPYIPDKYERLNVVWKGKEAEENHETLYILKLIDLSGNNLLGEIPCEVTGLDGLIALNLSSNHLVGSIPPNIGQVKLLNFLDLSGNNLTGRIPDALSQLNHLGVLNLSDNNLSGKIPWNDHLTTFDSYSFLGNPELCGRPLSHPCPGDDEKRDKPNFTHNVDGMDGDTFITKGFYISMTFGFIVGFWCALGALLLNRTCRVAYFRMPISVKN